ncbi:MAG: PilZ domain-containing protein [Novosphingobium sp.]
MEEPSLPNQPTERRTAQRTSLHVPVTFRERGRSELSATMTSVSQTGCSVTGGGLTFEGSQVWVRIPGLESMLSRVIWNDGIRCGLWFEQALHPAVADRFAASVLVQMMEPMPSGFTNAFELPSSRREQIRLGYAEAQSALLQSKRPSQTRSGDHVSALITRNVKREVNHRQEQRFADPHASRPMPLRIGKSSGEVIDVSASGLRVRVDLAPSVGKKVPVAFGNFRPMKGRVVWMKDGVVGIDLPAASIELSPHMTE